MTDGTFRDAGKFLDIRSRVVCCGEKGFLGIAFPPDYAQTGYFYVTFAGTGHTWNLEERRVSATDPDRADPDYKRRLIRVYKPLDYHWAGDMHFGADGYLYVTVGDGGFGGTHRGPGRPGQPRPGPGGHLRQDAAHRPAWQPQGGRPLQRPEVEPVRGQEGRPARDLGIRPAEPVALVVRQAHECDLWIGDVGMWSYEEVNRAKAPNAGKGDNFGWRRMEGPACYNPARRCDNGKLTLPFAWYTHKNGNVRRRGGATSTAASGIRRCEAGSSSATTARAASCSSTPPASRGQKPKVALDTDAQHQRLRRGCRRRAVHGRLRRRQQPVPGHRQAALTACNQRPREGTT